MWTCGLAPGPRMRAHGLVRPLFVVQSTWFGIPDVCDAKREWAEHGIKDHEVAITHLLATTALQTMKIAK